MLLMGDEVRRSQGGNNNAYCVDDETVWFDWSALERHADVHRFVQHLIALRGARSLPPGRNALTLNELLAQHRIEWHGVELGAPDWGDCSHSLAATLRFDDDGLLLHLMVNAYWEPLDFAVAPLPDGAHAWRVCVDTHRPSPFDIRSWADADVLNTPRYRVQPRSLAVLAASTRGGRPGPACS